MKINFVTLNMRGFWDKHERETLINDFVKNKTDVLTIESLGKKLFLG